MGVANLLRNGGQVVRDVSEILSKANSILAENEVLKGIIERQGAVVVAINDELGVVKRKLDEIQDNVAHSSRTATEIKHTKFYGQTVKLLDSAVEEVEAMSNAEIRKLIHRAARSHRGGRRKGYTHIYNKLSEVTGFDVYAHGKVTLKKSDGIEGWSKDPSYINTIMKQGKQREVAVICMQAIADN